MDTKNVEKNSEIGEQTSIGSQNIEESIEAFLRTIPPEKILSVLQELERQKKQKLEKELQDIETQISILNSRAMEIRKELGINKTSRKSRNTEFTLDGIPMSASGIARQFNLETYGINWRIKLLSILNGNSGGLPETTAAEIRRRVKYIGSP
jgi:hypothetical protein